MLLVHATFPIASPLGPTTVISNPLRLGKHDRIELEWWDLPPAGPGLAPERWWQLRLNGVVQERHACIAEPTIEVQAANGEFLNWADTGQIGFAATATPPSARAS